MIYYIANLIYLTTDYRIKISQSNPHFQSSYRGHIMARNRRTTQQKEVQDYRHDTATRKNNPPAGIAAQGKIQETPKQEYAYNPHLPTATSIRPKRRCRQTPRTPPKSTAASTHRRRGENPRRCPPDTTTGPWLEWAGKQEGGILHCRSGGIAYP